MNLPRRIVLAGVAAVAVGGVAIAAAKSGHVLTFRLPDGSVEQIRYIGDVAPTVRFEAPVTPASVTAAPDPLFSADAGFARLQQMSAEMDRQTAAMLRAMAAGPAPGGPGGFVNAGFGRMPAGAKSFTTVSTLSGSGVCTRSVEYTSTGDGKPPQVVSRASGDCAAPASAPGAISDQSPAQTPLGMVKASYAPNKPMKAAASGVWN